MFVFVYLHKYTALFLFRFSKWHKSNDVIPRKIFGFAKNNKKACCK